MRVRILDYIQDIDISGTNLNPTLPTFDFNTGERLLMAYCTSWETSSPITPSFTGWNLLDERGNTTGDATIHYFISNTVSPTNSFARTSTSYGHHACIIWKVVGLDNVNPLGNNLVYVTGRSSVTTLIGSNWSANDVKHNNLLLGVAVFSQGDASAACTVQDGWAEGFNGNFTNNFQAVGTKIGIATIWGTKIDINRGISQSSIDVGNLSVSQNGISTFVYLQPRRIG